MHLQLLKVRSGGSTKRYARLVQSYRCDDGMPTQRVIANLGEISDIEVENIRTALKASRAAKSVVLTEAATLRSKVLANLDYLSIAVALETWRSWNLSTMLTELISEREAAMCAADVICALTVRHCIAPGSKLQAQRWFPRIALPELLGVTPGRFHNTRIRRVLGRLDAIDARLQDGLVRRYEQRDGAFATLFTDVTDAWFEGRGPDIAERSRTK